MFCLQVSASSNAFRSELSSPLEAAGHLALWPALYAGAVICCFLQLAGLWRGDRADWIAIAAVVCTAMGTYLIDRVKLWPTLVDPSDRMSQPRRYAFLREYDAAARIIAAIFLLIGALLAARLSHWAPILILLSVIGTALYAPHPRGARPRLKDLLLIKNLYTTGGLVAFALLVSLFTWLPGYRPIAWVRLMEAPATLVAAAVLIARVLLDTVLCDIDDEHADRAHATQTAVTRFGPARVVRMVTIAHLMLACALPLCLPLAPLPRILWGACFLAGAAMPLRWRTGSRKDFIDARFPIEAAMICGVLAAFVH